jgi:Uma2 family endonuclease
MATVAHSENAVSPPVVPADKLLTPDDLLALSDEKRFELVEGRLVERNMGNLASSVGANITIVLGAYVKANHLGEVFNSEAGFRLSPNSPATVRKPDFSFVKRGRLPDDTPSSGYDALAPDLAVEVLSPNDLVIEVDAKREEYLRAGVRLIWIVNPDTRTMQVYRADGSTSLLREHDELSGEDVIPGFSCRVSSIFGRPAVESPNKSLAPAG